MFILIKILIVILLLSFFHIENKIMRIISGTAGRRNIKVPKTMTRPSTDRLREAIFSILGSRVVDARVLDLFAGSGALGLECLSRGAQLCDFVDDNRESANVIRNNLKMLGLAGGRVMEHDVFQFLRMHNSSYDLVFADPPYFKNPSDRDFVNELLTNESWPRLLSDDALLIIEDPPANIRLNDGNSLNLLDQRRYGGCGILFYQMGKNS